MTHDARRFGNILTGNKKIWQGTALLITMDSTCLITVDPTCNGLVIRSFFVSPGKLLRKQSSRRWFVMLWQSCNITEKRAAAWVVLSGDILSGIYKSTTIKYIYCIYTPLCLPIDILCPGNFRLICWAHFTNVLLILVWISNPLISKVWDEIIFPSSNFNDRVSNFHPTIYNTRMKVIPCG